MSILGLHTLINPPIMRHLSLWPYPRLLSPITNPNPPPNHLSPNVIFHLPSNLLHQWLPIPTPNMLMWRLSDFVP